MCEVQVEKSETKVRAKKYRIDTDKITWRIIDHEAVILNLDNGYYYSLNEIGILIWQALIEGKDLNKTLETISCKYQVLERTIRNDVKSLMRDLIKEKLVEIK